MSTPLPGFPPAGDGKPKADGNEVAALAALDAVLDRALAERAPWASEKTIAALAGFARWALWHRTTLVAPERWSDDHPAGVDVPRLFDYLAWNLATACEKWGMSEQVGVGWVALLAGAPDDHAFWPLEALLATEPAHGPSPGHQWAALGALGPLAFAAGLTCEEAEALVRSGTAEVVSLRTLAALRGYRLPATVGGGVVGGG